jgi:hypothetical protein
VCPVCGVYVPGNIFVFNSHLDACLEQKEKPRPAAEATAAESDEAQCPVGIDADAWKELPIDIKRELASERASMKPPSSIPSYTSPPQAKKARITNFFPHIFIPSSALPSKTKARITNFFPRGSSAAAIVDGADS